MKRLSKLLNEKNTKMTAADYFIVGIIIVLYSILSFVNLGSTNNPQTFYLFQNNEEIIFKFKDIDDLIRVKFFNGDENGEFAIYTSIDNETYSYLSTIIGNGAFTWNDERIATRTKYVKIISLSDSASLGEIAFYNNAKKTIDVNVVNSYISSTKKLLDEKNTVPDKINYMNSAYFDEIYFARTAYDYKENQVTYEWTHPPLGKLIQAIPIVIFNNMSPFFYRLMGNIAGIAMLFIMYLFGKQLFQRRKWAIFITLLMFFDTFHFAHTRMGTVDSFLVLFIMTSILFMYRHITIENSKYNLALSGIFFSLSICVKWTGFLCGIPLAIMYFTNIIKEKKSLAKSILQGFLFFVFIPIIIYISIYLLFPNNNIAYTDSIKDILIQTEEMYNYHSKLEEPHFFSSKWYTWPFTYKPVWYYTQENNTSTHGTISGIGNIVIWWMGILTLPYLIFKIFKKKDKNAYYIIVTILSLWLPYVFIGRVMFLYHYFPVLPFIMLAIGIVFNDLEQKTEKKYIMPIYLVLVTLFFIVYYPVVSGIPMNNTYLEKLQLFPSWYF